MSRDFIRDALLGVAVGDAIGVPAEFRSRQYLRGNPVTGVKGYGSHSQPPGTWSDDSSMTFCLAEMLIEKYDVDDLASRFINWMMHGYWTPHGEVFDIGIATSAAINRLGKGISPIQAGGMDETSNGNGSLMRILPLVFYVSKMDVYNRFRIIGDVSSLTHRHVRSVVACFIYIEIALRIREGMEKQNAYQQACVAINRFFDASATFAAEERKHFHRTLSGTIFTLAEDEIHSTGYVVHTLEAALWSLLTTENYEDAVLKAVNLGEDTDTTGAVTGGLAGLYYGWQSIPADWLKALVRLGDIEQLCLRLDKKLRENG